MTPQHAQPLVLLPPREAARRLGVSTRTLALLAGKDPILRAGMRRLPGKKGHRHRRYLESAIEAYIAALGNGRAAS